MTREQLINHFRHALEGHLEGFLSQKSAEENAHDEEVARVQRLLDAEKNEFVAKGLRMALKDLASNRPDGTAARREEAAQALVLAAGHFKLPVQLKASGAPAKASASGKRNRMTKKEVHELLGRIEDVLTDDYKTPETLAELAGVAKADARKALAKLRELGKAVANGAKGRTSAWKSA